MHPILQDTLSHYDTVVFVGGGTGGHISPIVSLAHELSGKDLIWIGGSHSQESSNAKKRNITFFSIPTLKLSTTRSPKIALYPWVLLRGIWSARKILQKLQERTDHTKICVFSKGGPGAVAVGIAAYSLGIPLYIHESDTIPGRSNTLLGKFANTIFLGFASAASFFPPQKTKHIGQILNPTLSIAPQIQKEGGIAWKTSKPHLLVFCGSQGARSIFVEILEHLEEILAYYEVMIVLGKLNTDMRTVFEARLGELASTHIDHTMTLLDWLDTEDQSPIFANTDLAITRGSATTLAELDLFGIKKIIIPLPSAARNHQYHNALEYAKNSDIMLEQSELAQLTPLILSFSHHAHQA